MLIAPNCAVRWSLAIGFTIGFQILSTAQAAAQGDPVARTLATPVVERGESVTINGENLASAGPATVALCSIFRTPCKHEHAHMGTSVYETANAITFVVPFQVPLGSYEVSIRFPDKPPITAQGKLKVTAPPPILTGVAPLVPFAESPGEGKPDIYSLTLSGSNFSGGTLAWENRLLVRNQRPLISCKGDNKEMVGGDINIVTATTSTKASAGACIDGLEVNATLDGKIVQFTGIPSTYEGINFVSVQVGDSAPTEERQVTFAYVSQAYPLWATAAVMGLIVLGFVMFVYKRKKRPISTMGKEVRTGALFLLDEETNSYSLSKFQFYAWTFAILTGYTYLSVALSWVQGKFEFAAVPDGLPMLLGTAALTSVATTGVVNFKGNKGQGVIEPRFSDFFTQGGLVAPERLQYFLWTIIGSIWFIMLSLSISPTEIETLPSVPTDYAALTGLSALGYVAGKAARKAGPRITGISGIASPSSAPTTLELIVTGAGLSFSATALMQIGLVTATTPPGTTAGTAPGTTSAATTGILPGTAMAVVNKTVEPAMLIKPGTNLPDIQVIETDKQAGEDQFAKSMKVTIHKPDKSWIEDPKNPKTYRFTLTNPDGQKAEEYYTLRADT